MCKISRHKKTRCVESFLNHGSTLRANMTCCVSAFWANGTPCEIASTLCASFIPCCFYRWKFIRIGVAKLQSRHETFFLVIDNKVCSLIRAVTILRKIICSVLDLFYNSSRFKQNRKNHVLCRFVIF